MDHVRCRILVWLVLGKYRSPGKIQIRPDKLLFPRNQKPAVAAPDNSEFQRAFVETVNLLTCDTERALGVMFDLTAQRLVRFAMTITGNQPDAEDALQGAFSRIAGKPRLLARADSPWPYLIRTVRNEALRILQKRRHITSSDSLDARPSGSEDSETAMVFEETNERVRRVLGTLPQSQYEVVILKHWEDLTFAEIAEALGLSQNTVASRYRYAMEKLQRSLEPLMK